MSSSNRVSTPCQASVYRESQGIGPLRLPMKDQEAFIAEFNQRYRSLGLRAEGFRIEKAPSEDAAEQDRSKRDAGDAS